MLTRISYADYSSSGITWAPSIPKHWKPVRCKLLLEERVEKNHPDEPLLAATQTKGVVRKDAYENRTVTALKDFHLLKLVREGDFVISLRSFEGGIEYARHRGIISPAYTILFPADASNHAYLSLLFKSRPFIDGLTLFVTGIREGQNIDYEKLSRTPLPLPPPDEQAAIVRYLDYVDRRIRKYIRAKKKLIALLNEQKQAIIHRAVTRGLDPDVKMKPSGVEWLGEVPAHWEVSKVGFFARVGNGSTPSRGNVQFWAAHGLPWLNSSYANKDAVTEANKFVTEVALKECHLPILEPGAVLMAITGQGKTRGKATVLKIRATINQHLAYIIPKGKLIPEFLTLFFGGAYAELRRISDDTGSTKGALTCESIRRFVVPVPPTTEQHAICKSVSKDVSSLSATIAKTETEIGLISEYRTRLIADVVTGKLDVREAAAKLPDEVNEPIDEARDLIDEPEEPAEEPTLDD